MRPAPLFSGCSAFLAGQVATLNFGNPGHLDGKGGETRGTDGIRIDARAVDTQANHEVNLNGYARADSLHYSVLLHLDQKSY